MGRSDRQAARRGGGGRRSREEADDTRRTIVEAASQLFRARGIAAVSVADVMSAVGLTVGGFYRHFESKEALVAEAIAAASTASLGEFAVATYLSPGHRDHPELGCPVAALCSEVAHEGAAIRGAFTDALRALIDRAGSVEGAVALVGGIVLARATDDDALARQILAAARARL